MKNSHAGTAPGRKDDAMSAGLRSSTVSIEAAMAYERVLMTSRLSRSTDPIPNRYPWHCRIAVRELMRLAIQLQCEQKKVGSPVTIRLLTGTLSKNVYGSSLLASLGDFLGIGGHLKILVWNTEKAIFESYGHNSPLMSFASVPGLALRFSGSRDFGDKLMHFMTVDDFAFRMEAPHPYFESNTFNDFEPDIPAQISFNNPAVTRSLNDFFESLWETAPESKGLPVAKHK